eukprot:TRINITY_DN1889_c0_g1_i1.p1 TRINITY_DN1889_c0_g1~~TRINITY_DN1889_c0_g1_i1.p1  ORF type:complete len:248 (-),score=29.08 TRINITY_DN1889_c0_g1_i1:271-1014(-)
MFDLQLRTIKQLVLERFCFLFAAIHPNAITITAGVFGIICVYCSYLGRLRLALFLWLINRLLDGIDGVVARFYHKTSDFGGYLDILLDFVVYGSIPIALVLGLPPSLSLSLFGVQISRESALVVVCFLEVTYFVNAAGLFYLSAILEKLNAGAQSRNELTCVTMTPGFIEGAETVVVYSLFFILPRSMLVSMFLLFALGVCYTIIQRASWAFSVLQPARPTFQRMPSLGRQPSEPSTPGNNVVSHYD